MLLHTYDELIPGTLIRRYKRFLADVRLADGREVTAFTPNSGSMKTCSDPGSPVMISADGRPGRKTEFTLQMVRSGDTWVGVHTSLPNLLAERAINGDLTGVEALRRFRVLRREATWEDSRFDLLAGNGRRTCYIEVKNVTYRDGETARFPDAVTARGAKHLNTLVRALGQGHLAANVYCVQRSDCSAFAPAADIDPHYAETFGRALEAGVIMVPLLFHVTPEGIWFKGTLPFRHKER